MPDGDMRGKVNIKKKKKKNDKPYIKNLYSIFEIQHWHNFALNSGISCSIPSLVLA